MYTKNSFAQFILNTITENEISTPDLIAKGIEAGYTKARANIHYTLSRFKRDGLIAGRRARIPSRTGVRGGPRFYSYWKLPGNTK